MPLTQAIRLLADRQRRRKERLAAAKRLGHDDAAWAALFRRDEWAPLPAGHLGRCGGCGAEIDLHQEHCPQCGAVWGANARRGDLYRQIAALGGAIGLSVLIGYASTQWVRGQFEGKNANPEMVDTLASFSWMLFSVLAMIALTYAIEHFRLAPAGHWRKKQAEAGESRRRTDG